MSSSTVLEDQLYLGIDGGGSKCKAIIASADQTVLGTGISGPANPLHGYEQTLNSIVHSTQLALEDAKIPQSKISSLIAGVGLAGVNLPELFDKVAKWQHPFARLYLTTDLHIACLGAHKGLDGAVIISGTGSCGYASVNGKTLTVGGHGFPHGDLGSGAWTGFNAISSVLLSIDGLIEPTVLTNKVLDFYEAKSALELVGKVAKKPASYYAKIAGLVFDAAKAGDAVALSIVEKGAGYITNVARKLWLENPPRMSIIGGLTEPLMPWLSPEIAQHLSPPICPPELGAVLFALQKESMDSTNLETIEN